MNGRALCKRAHSPSTTIAAAGPVAARKRFPTRYPDSRATFGRRLAAT